MYMNTIHSIEHKYLQKYRFIHCIVLIEAKEDSDTG